MTRVNHGRHLTVPVLSNFNLHLPANVLYGRGTLTDLVAHLPTGVAPGAYLFLISDAVLLKLGTVERVSQLLRQAGFRVHHFSEVPAEPPTCCVADAVASYEDTHGPGQPPACVIGLGGGSVLDVAKIVSLCLGHQRPASDFFGINRVPSRGVPTILIPTTAGTGSEVTPVSVLTDTEKQVKARTWSPHLLPDLALVDPQLTDSVPPQVTAATGIDALVHAIEATIAKVSNPYSRALAFEAVRQLASGLREVYRDGSDQPARDAVALGSHFAGLSFANSSCAAVHALALPLGGRFHIAHGEANANLLAATMRVNLPACRDDFTRLASAMNLPDTRPEAFLDELEAIKQDLGIPESLTAYGVTADALPDLARHAVEIRTLIEPNPVEVDEATALAIYQSCL